MSLPEIFRSFFRSSNDMPVRSCCCLLFALLFYIVPAHAQQKRRIHEVEVVKFDNYDAADGEQKLYKEHFADTIPLPVFDLAFALNHFNFPPANDTLRKILSGKPASAYKPAVFDTKKRLVHYYRNAREHYEFEYNSAGNIQYIKRWGAKHVTAQLTFIYVY
jgi:hypothetical protein